MHTSIQAVKSRPKFKAEVGQNIVNILRNSIKKLNNLCDFASLKIYTKLKSNYTYKLF